MISESESKIEKSCNYRKTEKTDHGYDNPYNSWIDKLMPHVRMRSIVGRKQKPWPNEEANMQKINIFLSLPL